MNEQHIHNITPAKKYFFFPAIKTDFDPHSWELRRPKGSLQHTLKGLEFFLTLLAEPSDMIKSLYLSSSKTWHEPHSKGMSTDCCLFLFFPSKASHFLLLAKGQILWECTEISLWNCECERVFFFVSFFGKWAIKQRHKRNLIRRNGYYFSFIKINCYCWAIFRG